MALYFLSYDLRNRRDYQTLYDELVNFNAVRILESLWCFNRIDTTSAEIRDHFKNYIDGDDGLVVSKADGWATFNAINTPKDL